MDIARHCQDTSYAARDGFGRRIPTIAITLIVGSFAVGNLLLMASAFL